MKEIGIVICNYNKENQVLDCIQSVLESRFQDFDLYVVDNGSTDHSVSAIRSRYGDRLTLLENRENLGGSGGFNTGLRVVYEKGYPFLMCIDNDALLDENAIGSLRDFLLQHEEAGMAGAKIYHLEEPDFVQQFGQRIDFEHFCTESYFYNEYEDGSMPPYLFVDCVAACALMVRRSVVDEIGLMPEDNFLYWDDTEWCYRCNLAGYKVASVGAAVALHAMGAKNETVNTFPTYYAWRNWIRFFLKYTPQDRWEALVETFLESIFQEIYEGLCKEEKKRAQTVMLAYDDAIHGVVGKAGENRIFPLDRNEEPWRRLFSSSDAFCITGENYPGTAQAVKKKAEQLGYKIQWTEHTGDAKEIVICDSIFNVEDLSRQKIYIDINDCILQSEEDVLNVINYNYSKKSFVFAQKPVFFQKIKEYRKKESE